MKIMISFHRDANALLICLIMNDRFGTKLKSEAAMSLCDVALMQIYPIVLRELK